MQPNHTNEPNHPSQEISKEQLRVEKLSDSLHESLQKQPDKLHSVIIWPATGQVSWDQLQININQILSDEGLPPLKVTLSCGFILEAKVNLAAADRLCKLPEVASLAESWSGESF